MKLDASESTTLCSTGQRTMTVSNGVEGEGPEVERVSAFTAGERIRLSTINDEEEGRRRRRGRRKGRRERRRAKKRGRKEERTGRTNEVDLDDCW